MRVIAGKFKGRKLFFTSDDRIRPTSDFVRQAFFTKIQFEIKDSTFLDLFSGNGSIGLEALSRGAKEVYFVENDKRAYDLIEKNLIKLYGENYIAESANQGQIIHLILSDFVDFLNSITASKIFDFVYIDPPYKSNFYKTALDKLQSNRLITNESLIICEWSRRHERPSFEGYNILSEKRYGTKNLTYLNLIS